MLVANRPREATTDAHPTDRDNTTPGPLCATVLQTCLATRPGTTRGRDPGSGQTDRERCLAGGAGLGHARRFERYHRVLSRATWSSREASRVLLGLLVRTFLADEGEPLVIGVD